MKRRLGSGRTLKKVVGYYVILSESFEYPSVRAYVRPSARPSVSASFPDTNQTIFYRFSSNIAWALISGRFVIVTGLNSFIINRVMTPD